MMKAEALTTLEHCKQIFIKRVHSAIADYAQYGMELVKLETAVEKQDWSKAKTEILKSLAGCPGCDLEIVNSDGDLARNLRYMLAQCELLIKNRNLTEKIHAI